MGRLGCSVSKVNERRRCLLSFSFRVNIMDGELSMTLEPVQGTVCGFFAGRRCKADVAPSIETSITMGRPRIKFVRKEEAFGKTKGGSGNFN